MGNPLKYIRQLEAAGFDRTQAEAQVQIVLEAMESELVTKNDFAVMRVDFGHQAGQFEGRIENRMTQFEEKIENRMTQFENKIENRMTQFE